MNYEDLLAASAHIRYTVWKYFNRAKYRATPFGSFAGIGLLDLGATSDNTIILESEQRLHIFQDWSQSVATSFLENDNKDLKYITNHSYYVVRNAIRYVSRFDNQHEISEVESDPVILKILKLCTTSVSFDDILKFTIDSLCPQSIEALVSDLVDAQLLFTTDQPQVITAANCQKLTTQPSLPERCYVISERRVAAGALPLAQCRHLPEFTNLLNGLLKPKPAPELTEFISRFRQKFGEQWIPIMEALDPEIGLGYGNLEQVKDEGDFHPSMKSQSASNKVSRLKQQLLNNIIPSVLQNSRVVCVENLDLKSEDDRPTLPNTLTLLVSVSDNMIHLESIGGCTTNAVSGRFSLCGDPYQQYCREMKDLEQHANPDVLFFDIAYTSEKDTENINRRTSIYDFQLNLLNYGALNQLSMDDLFLSLQGNELILYSRKLSKRMVPRMASAYNYSRSDLAVFRLLCDLQHQGLQTDLNLNLRDLHPGLSYYPRLMFKNIIISPAAWKIDVKALATLKKIDASSVSAHLKSLGIPRLFKTGETDQTLRFDQDEEVDMWAFVNYLNKQKDFYVKEAWNSEFTKDTSGRSYQNQMIITLTHGHQIYKRYEPNFPIGKLSNSTTCFLPGSHWLYFQIYCHPFRAEQLLLDFIKPFLNEYRANIEKWFFIRYDENGHHIRFRLSLKDPGLGMKLTARLSSLLDPYLQAGIISEFLISTYKPEIQRYGKDLIEQVEAHFCRDSELMLALLPTPLNTFEKYRLCEDVLNTVRRSDLFKSQEFDQLIQTVSDAFASEFDASPLDFKYLNENYRKYLGIIPPLLSRDQQLSLDLYYASLLELLDSCKTERRSKLLTDLIHMHVNRLFLNAQRRHEFAIYYFTSKMLKRARPQVAG